jgi:hypothetical protein
VASSPPAVVSFLGGLLSGELLLIIIILPLPSYGLGLENFLVRRRRCPWLLQCVFGCLGSV